MERIVFIIDDDDQVRISLVRLLSSAGYTVTAFASASLFFCHPLPAQPCCLIVDMTMPVINGFDVVRQLEQRGDALPVIFISGHGTIPMTVQAMKAGAREFFTKPIISEQLLDAVEEALSFAEKNLLSRTERVASTTRLEKLTPREREVLELAIGGLLNKQIATELGISEITAKVHKRRVMDKMEAKTLADLVRVAERLQISRARSR